MNGVALTNKPCSTMGTNGTVEPRSADLLRALRQANKATSPRSVNRLTDILHSFLDVAAKTSFGRSGTCVLCWGPILRGDLFKAGMRGKAHAACIGLVSDSLR